MYKPLQAPKVIGSTGKILKSGPNDRVFVYFADHGAPGRYLWYQELMTQTSGSGLKVVSCSLSDFTLKVAMLEHLVCTRSLPECVLLSQVSWACQMAHSCTLTS